MQSYYMAREVQTVRHDMEDPLRHFPACFTEYGLASLSEKSPRFHVTDDNGEPSLDVELLDEDATVACQIASVEEFRFCPKRFGL